MSTISQTPTLLKCPPFLRLQRCYVSPFLRLHHFSDSNVAKMSTISPTLTLLTCPPFPRLTHFSVSTISPTPTFLRLYTHLFHCSLIRHCFFHITISCSLFPSKWLIRIINWPFKFVVIHWCRGICPIKVIKFALSYWS